jgi:hypothetical protein
MAAWWRRRALNRPGQGDSANKERTELHGYVAVASPNGGNEDVGNPARLRRIARVVSRRQQSQERGHIYFHVPACHEIQYGCLQHFCTACDSVVHGWQYLCGDTTQ